MVDVQCIWNGKAVRGEGPYRRADIGVYPDRGR
ncbi:hypothetical protein SAMN05414139_08494 [Burkholderia sp. D7]|nr:hypothetical protein SAMN05414139_08494 [Burkholderia sp. D7]